MSAKNNDVPRGTKTKIQLPSRMKAQAQTADERILALAHAWAELHAKPNTRDQMDKVIAGLTEADQRKVYLCGQRIAAGMPPKIAQ